MAEPLWFSLVSTRGAAETGREEHTAISRSGHQALSSEEGDEHLRIIDGQ